MAGLATPQCKRPRIRQQRGRRRRRAVRRRDRPGRSTAFSRYVPCRPSTRSCRRKAPAQRLPGQDMTYICDSTTPSSATAGTRAAARNSAGSNPSGSSRGAGPRKVKGSASQPDPFGISTTSPGEGATGWPVTPGHSWYPCGTLPPGWKGMSLLQNTRLRRTFYTRAREDSNL